MYVVSLFFKYLCSFSGSVTANLKLLAWKNSLLDLGDQGTNRCKVKSK